MNNALLIWSVCCLCSPFVRFVSLCEEDENHNHHVWASARCVAQYPDTYYMAVGKAGGTQFFAQQFKVPKGFAIISELQPSKWINVIIKGNREKIAKEGRKAPALFEGCITRLIKNHGLFGAILPNEGPPLLTYRLPGAFDRVQQKRTGKGAKDFDPLQLMYPLFPENDQGDSTDLDNDGACMLDPDSIAQHREHFGLPPIHPVSAISHVQRRCVCACGRAGQFAHETVLSFYVLLLCVMHE